MGGVGEPEEGAGTAWARGSRDGDHRYRHGRGGNERTSPIGMRKLSIVNRISKSHDEYRLSNSDDGRHPRYLTRNATGPSGVEQQNNHQQLHTIHPHHISLILKLFESSQHGETKRTSHIAPLRVDRTWFIVMHSGDGSPQASPRPRTHWAQWWAEITVAYLSHCRAEWMTAHRTVVVACRHRLRMMGRWIQVALCLMRRERRRLRLSE